MLQISRLAISYKEVRRWIKLGLAIVLLTSCGSAPLATPSSVSSPTLTRARPSTTPPHTPTVTEIPTTARLSTATLTSTATSQRGESDQLDGTSTAQAIVSTTPTPSKTPEKATSSPPVTTATNTPRPRSSRMASPEYGMQAFLWWRPEVATRDLGLIEDAGFGWVKQDFAWKEIEGAGKGLFDWSHTDFIVQYTEDAGLDILVRLDRAPSWTGAHGDGPPSNLSDFGDFAYEVANRYRSRIRAYQIWNEPNLAREWGERTPSPEGYVALLQIAYEAIKKADPDAIVISAGLSPTGSQPPQAIPDDQYLSQMYQAGAIEYFDMLGLNAPGFKAPPEMSPDEVMANQEVYGHGRWFCFRHVEDLREIMVQNGDQNKQVVILEFGWTTDPRPESPYNWHAVDNTTQAEYLVRAYQYAREHWSPWIGLMSLIYISDPDWTSQNEQYWWAITSPGYPEPELRPSYKALQAIPK